MKLLTIVFYITLFTKSLSCLAMEVAITVDDLPLNGQVTAFSEPVALSNEMLTTFTKFSIKGVVGFVNGNRSADIPETNNILLNWERAGQLLGNHTYSHLDLSATTSEAYIADIQQNDEFVSRLTGHEVNYFRYPYLAEGNSRDKRNQVQKYLFVHSYRIAEVTVDFFEYEWNEPYLRCLAKNDTESLAWLRKSYLEQARNSLIIAHELPQMLFDRDIKHIALIHLNRISVDMLDQLIQLYIDNKVKIISMENALSDPIYQINPEVVANRSYTFLNQVRLSRNLENPDVVKKLYASLPEEKLEAICR